MTDYLSKEEPLKNRIQQILLNENLDTERAFIRATTAELGIDNLTYAAALTYLNQLIENTSAPVLKEDNQTNKPLSTKATPLSIKMVRYRLDVGTKHHVTLEQLKKVLIEESGVDKNNINNVNIQSLYTLIELPDEMPPDIFQHLKSVEINQHKLDIRRVKTRNKKRGNFHMHRGRKRNLKPVKEISDQVNNNKIETVQPRIDTDAH
jgi:hypothetical protein